MKIHEVMERTGLTKKAINYYEEQGLVRPGVNIENSYREYSQENIDTLMQIAVLRQLDIPIKDIKAMLSNPSELQKVLEYHLEKLNGDIQRLEKSKNLLKSCLSEIGEKDSKLSEITAKLSTLSSYLQMDAKSREGFMKKQLRKLFPGVFGSMLISHFGPYLNEPIDTPEKEEAWLSVVKFLDSVQDIDYPGDMSMLLNRMHEYPSEKNVKYPQSEIDVHLSLSSDDFEQQKNIIDKYLTAMENNLDLKAFYQRFFKATRGFKEVLSRAGYYNNFVNNLRILSHAYDEYMNNVTGNLSALKEALKIKIDEDGNIVREEEVR